MLKNNAELPDEEIMAQLSELNTVRIEKLVKEFLMAQSLTILPQNSFGDAVSQFVDKDDKHAMEMFVNESLSNQLKHLMEQSGVEEEDLTQQMEEQRLKLESAFASGQTKRTKKIKLNPKPDNWDSDLEGEWAEQPESRSYIDNDEQGDDDNLASLPVKKPVARGRGKAASITRKPVAEPKKPVTRGKKKVVEEEEDEGDDDVIMIDDEDEEEEEDEDTLFVKPSRTTTRKPPARTTRAKSPVKKTAAKGRAPTKQSTLNFSQATTQRSQPAKMAPSRKKAREPVHYTFSTTALKLLTIMKSDDEIDEISDDDDAFEPASTSRVTRSRR